MPRVPGSPVFKADNPTHRNCPSWSPGPKAAGMFSVVVVGFLYCVFVMKKFEFIPNCIFKDLK